MKSTFFAVCFVVSIFGKYTINTQEYEGPPCPIDDPYLKVDTANINFTAHPIARLDLGSKISNLIIEGLSTLTYKIEFDALILDLHFEINLERGTGSALYTAQGYLDARPFRPETFPSGNLTGFGFGNASITNAHIKGNALLSYNLPDIMVRIHELNIESFHFDSLNVDLGETFIIDGKTPDWTELSNHIKENFDLDWSGQKKDITEKIRLMADGISSKYTFSELFDLLAYLVGGGDDWFC